MVVTGMLNMKSKEMLMQVIIMHKVINQSIEISKILGVAKSLIFYKEGMHWPVEG